MRRIVEIEKYKVFIGSPFFGLEEQRRAAIRAVINWGQIPITLDDFSPQRQRDLDFIRRAIKDCQIYILIIGHRYGNTIEIQGVNKGEEISYTQFLFEEALEGDLVPLVFLKDEQLAITEIMNDENILEKETEINRLKSLHETIKKEGVFLNFWSDNTNLEEVCGRALAQVINEKKKRQPNKSIKSFKHDIFLSYTAGDSHIAKELSDELKLAGLRCFMAEKDLKVGSDWNEDIRNSLRSAHRIVLLITPRSLRKHWPLMETGAAWALGKDIVPALINVEIDELPDPVQRFHARTIETMKQRKELIAELCGLNKT